MSSIKFFIAGLTMWLPLIFFAGGALVYAQSELFPNEVCPQNSPSEVCRAAEGQGTTDPVSGPGGLINKVANIIALIAGVVAVVVIIISGIMYATAGGAPGGQRAGDSPNNAKKARQALIGALIGLVVVALAWSITRFIVDRVVQ